MDHFPCLLVCSKEVYYVAIDVGEQLRGAKTASLEIQLGLGWRDDVSMLGTGCGYGCHMRVLRLLLKYKKVPSWALPM